jgi:ferredoxin
MPFIITDPCIETKDTACVDVCPVDCIHPRKDEPEFAQTTMLYIHPEECIDCGACEPECPVEAIFPEDALPEKWEPFVKINAAYLESFDVVNRLTDEYATEHNVQNEPLS